MKNFPSIRKNSEYQLVYRNGSSRLYGCILMYVRENERAYNRIGISISKKVGNSVVRHTFCRKIREIFRSSNLNTVQGYDIVVSARKQAAEASYHQLEHDYKILLRDHNILLNRNE